MTSVQKGQSKKGIKLLQVTVAVLVMVAISIGSAILVHDRSGAVPASVNVESGLSAYELAVQYGYEGNLHMM